MASYSLFEFWSTAKHCLLVDQVSAGHYIVLAASLQHRNPVTAPEPSQAIGSTESAEVTETLSVAETESEETFESYWSRLNSVDVFVLWGLHRITSCAVCLSVWRCRPRRKPRSYRLKGLRTLFVALCSKSVRENADDVFLNRTPHNTEEIKIYINAVSGNWSHDPSFFTGRW
jgi:hypothetical protein